MDPKQQHNNSGKLPLPLGGGIPVTRTVSNPIAIAQPRNGNSNSNSGHEAMGHYHHGDDGDDSSSSSDDGGSSSAHTPVGELRYPLSTSLHRDAEGGGGGAMAYSLNTRYSSRHRRTAKHQAATHGMSRSLPPPRAPMLSYRGDPPDRLVSSMPPIALPDSVHAEEDFRSGGRSVPYGSLRNSHLHRSVGGDFGERSASRGGGRGLGGFSMPTSDDSFRNRVRQRWDESVQREGQGNNNAERKGQYTEFNNGADVEEADGTGGHEGHAGADEDTARLGTSLTAMSILTMSRGVGKGLEDAPFCRGDPEDAQHHSSQKLPKTEAATSLLHGALQGKEEAPDFQSEVMTETMSAMALPKDDAREARGVLGTEHGSSSNDHEEGSCNPDAFEAFDIELDE